MRLNSIWLTRRGDQDTDNTQTEGQPWEYKTWSLTSLSKGERLRKKPELLAPWPWTFTLQNCEKINFCCLSLPSVVFCNGSLSKIIQHPGPFYFDLQSHHVVPDGSWKKEEKQKDKKQLYSQTSPFPLSSSPRSHTQHSHFTEQMVVSRPPLDAKQVGKCHLFDLPLPWIKPRLYYQGKIKRLEILWQLTISATMWKCHITLRNLKINVIIPQLLSWIASVTLRKMT